MLVGFAERPCALFRPVALCLILSLFLIDPARVARAGIVASSGVTLLGSPPPGNVLPGAQQPTSLPLFFPEVLAAEVTSLAGLPVDHVGTDLAPVLVQSMSVVDPSLLAGAIPFGTRFDSYIFHFDPDDAATPSAANFYVDVHIEFSMKILGLQLFSSANALLDKPAGTDYVGTLEAGDAEIFTNGGPGAAYYPSSSSFRGLDEDSISIDLASHRILFAGKAFGNEIDQVRMIVAAVPEPQSLLILGAATAILGASVRRSRYTRSSE